MLNRLVFLRLVLLALTLIAFATSQPSRAVSAARILHFPKTGVGVVQFIPDTPYVHLDRKSPGSVIARGDVALEANQAALLNIDVGGMRDLSFLKKLKPDDLAAITLGYGWQGTDAEDKDVEALTCLSGLKGLDLKRSDITDKCIPSLLKFQKLEWLCLRATLISATGVPKLASLKNLCSLDFSENKLDGTDWRWLRSESRLTQLTLGHCKLRDDNAAPIFLPRLTYLKVNENPLTDKAFVGLSACKHLRYLNMDQAAITEVTYRRIAMLSELQELEINGCKLNAVEVKMLAKLPLMYLRLGETTLDDSTVDALCSLKNLSGLSLNGTKAQEARLRKALPKTSITHVTPLAQRHPIMEMQD